MLSDPFEKPAMGVAALPDDLTLIGEMDEAARVRLAAGPDTPAEAMRLLADDQAVLVRAAVALNPNYSKAVHITLVADGDERVRALLAAKVARLLPQLSGQDQRDAQAHAHQVLLTLAGDAAVRVRGAMAEVLQSMPEAPRAVIMALAQDRAVSVSEPILRLSPLLTDTDLLELLASPPHPLAAQAIANRSRVSAAVADAIAARAGDAAIRALLQNRSAVIREATLEALIGRASEHPDWHEPLVQRPWLAEKAAQALSHIVTNHLLDALLQRADLPTALADEIRVRIGTQLPEASNDTEVMARLHALQATRPLTEPALVEAAKSGDPRRVAMILAITGGVSLDCVDRATALHNAKGLVSLVWRAGFSMETAVLVQSMIGCLGPREILKAPTPGAFPLCVSEMEWQIELLTSPTD